MFTRRRLAVGLAVLAALLVADYHLYPRWAGIGGVSLNTGENGLWLRHSWYTGQRSDADVRELARALRDRQIRYAFFHVRHIATDGTLRYRHADTSRRLVATLHEEAPSVEAIAWAYAGELFGEGEVDLSSPVVREAMVGEASWLVEECDFDGVQWDYEVCHDGNPHFLQLMRQTREALPDDQLLSAAVPLWVPPGFRRWGWSDDYFAQVAATCDQLAVMCYDSAQYLPRSYVWLVRQQAVHVTQAVARGNPNCRVLLGVPTYGDEGSLPSHRAHAENIRLALKGVREGLIDSRADRSVFAGVAVFADYTTEPEEWDLYQRLWLDAAPP